MAYIDMHIVWTYSKKFLGLIADDALSWKNHTDYITAKLNSACFAIRTVKSLLSKDALKMLCSSYIHSIASYGVIFSGNSPDSIKTFRIQNKTIWIVANLRNRIHVGIYFNNENITLLFTMHIMSDTHSKQ
jgi:hypothetical protein